MENEVFDELIQSIKEAGQIRRGEKSPSRKTQLEIPDIKQIRAQFKLTQVQFASMLGISVGTLRNWEQGRRNPEGPAMVLLKVAEKHPEAVLDVTRVA